MEIKEEFTKVIKANEGLIYKITTLYTDGKQDRKDLYQEIVFQLWKSFGSFSEQSKLSTWMYRVALNTAIFHLKQSKRRPDTIPFELEMDRLTDESDKAEEDRIKLLYEQIQQLNLLEKGIILLFLEGKSHEEIAEIVGISVSNVGTKISRIKEKLKSQIKKKTDYGT
jgi:RNA polymerase sigma-70 factor (ECF subfamily)